MMRLLNAISARWNRLIYWCHDAATRTGIGWLVTASIWAYDRLTWRLPERWQLICGVPLVEYTLRHELELSQHQARWYAEYAYELQMRMLALTHQEEGDSEELPCKPQRRNPARKFAGSL